MQRTVLILAYFFICTNSIAQQYPFVHYTPKDGLISNSIRSIYQDSKGRLYFTSANGLSIYDGSRFINYINKVRRQKEKELKSFTDELEKTTREGLLDSPAVVLVMYYPSPVFETDPEKGSMLVTDNPDYIRKALPNYIPQFIVLTWRWSDYPVHKEYEKILLQDFPIEKLQAMIDK